MLWRLIIFLTENKIISNGFESNEKNIPANVKAVGESFFRSYFRHTGTIIIHCNGHIGSVRNDIDENEHEGLSNKFSYI